MYVCMYVCMLILIRMYKEIATFIEYLDKLAQKSEKR